MKMTFFSLLVIPVLLLGCKTAGSQAIPSLTSTQVPQITKTVNPTPVPSQTSTPTQAAFSPTPARTSTPIAALLSCQDQPHQATQSQLLELLYANNGKLWSWDEASGESSLADLPEEAVSPLISPDGTYAAYFLSGQSYDTPEKPVEEIPLWLLDLRTEEKYLVGKFSTVETRAFYPDSPFIYLKLVWLPGGQQLLVQVFPYPWGEGILQPAGSLYLVDPAARTNHLLLGEGTYEIYSIHPNGHQIAALDTAAISPGGSWNYDRYQQGILHLIDLTPKIRVTSIPIRLPANPWAFVPPVYSPDGGHLAFNDETGLGIVDNATGSLQSIQIENTCLVENNCQWTDYLPVYWKTDGSSFYTTQTINDYFDERAQTLLSQVFIEPVLYSEAITTIHANPHTFLFSPDRSILTYWNQPDIESIEQNPDQMNRVTLFLLDVNSLKTVQYSQTFLLRLKAWNPDSQRFLFSYSINGGANPNPDQLALGNICQSSQALVMPKSSFANQIEWLSESRFLAWTLPSEGISNQYHTGLYLYDLEKGASPQQIANLFQDMDDPYGDLDQVVVIYK